MTTTTANQENQETLVETPKIGTKIAHFSNLWVLYYRHGMNPLLTKVFHLDGNLLDAVKRGRKHCELMNYKYHFTRPLVFDLEEEEAYRLKGGLPVADS